MHTTVGQAAGRRAGIATVLGAGVLLAALILVPWLSDRARASGVAQAHVFRGMELLNARDYSGAEREWLSGLRASPRNPNLYRALGTVYLSQGRLADARTMLLRLAELSPREPHALCELAEAELRTGAVPMIERAADDGSRAAALEPDCLRAQMTAGNAWLERGDSRRGLEHLRQAVRLNPADVPLTLHLIQHLIEGEQLREAVRRSRELTQRYPGYGHGYALLGTCAQMLPPGDPDARDVEQVLSTATRLEPGNPLAHAQLGRYYLNAGRHREAVRELEVARLLNPQKTTVLFSLSRAYQATGRQAEAREVEAAFRRRSRLENELVALERRGSLQPGDTALLVRMARIAEALGEPRRAERYLQRARTVAPGMVEH